MTKGDDQVWAGSRPMKELPVLPEQVSARVWIGSHWVDENEMQYVYSEDGDGEPLYTADQLKAYGAACAAHAREMALEDAKQAAEECDVVEAKGNTYYAQLGDASATQRGIVDAIEAIKGK